MPLGAPFQVPLALRGLGPSPQPAGSPWGLRQGAACLATTSAPASENFGDDHEDGLFDDLAEFNRNLTQLIG